MKLTTKGRYAMMAVVDMERFAYISENQKTRKPVPLVDIAKRQGITLAYLEQIFARLKARGIVKSVRGPGGGYMLAREPKNITAKDVLFAADESIKITRCDKGSERSCMSNNAQCVVHNLWSGMDRAIINYLSAISLADIVHGDLHVNDFNDRKQQA